MNDYLKIYPPSVDKESLFLDTLSKIFTNFPLNITKQILSDNLPIILSCQDKNIFTNLTQVLSNYNFKYEFLSQIEENSLDKKRLLIVINSKNPNVYTLVNMYTIKSTQDLFTEELIDTDTLNSLNTVKCNKCDNITPSDLNFCIFCVEDIFKEFEQRYTLQIIRFSNKNPDNDKIKVKKFFYELLQMNFEESNKILNNLPCYLSFDSSKETAEFIKSTLSSFNIDCKYVSENESQDWLNKVWNIFNME